MKEIDNGLLSEILGEEVNETIILEGSILKYSYKYLGYAEINIYELAHLNLKQWALSKGYRLISFGRECFLYEMQELYDVSEQLNQWSEWFEADTELEAVTKACEWIRNKIREEK